METLKLQQKSIAGNTTGSFVNYLMGNNTSQPKVGEGATILHWTDRSAYEVIDVSEDGMQCTIQRYIPERIDNNGMSESQKYKYEELSDEKMTLVYNRGAWRQLYFEVRFTKEFIKTLPENTYCYAKHLSPELKEAVYSGECRPVNVVDGVTHKVKCYRKISIIFGEKCEYYDYSF